MTKERKMECLQEQIESMAKSTSKILQEKDSQINNLEQKCEQFKDSARKALWGLEMANIKITSLECKLNEKEKELKSCKQN